MGHGDARLQSLLDKYQQGMISREEVITKSQDPTTMQAKLQELELAQAQVSQTSPANA